MIEWMVSKDVGNANNDRPELIEPVRDAQRQLEPDLDVLIPILSEWNEC